MSISKGGQRQSQNSTTNVDPVTQAYMKQVMDAARGAGSAGPSPLVTGAGDYNTGLMKAGNLGMGALSGDPSAVASLMNPYQSQVIDANNAMWQRMNSQALNQVDDRATQAGAFGGSRNAVASGTALSNNNIAQGAQTAGLLNSGFSDMMQRAAGMAGMGFQGAGANANLGMGGVGNPQQWLMQMLKQGYMGPMGQSSSGTSAGTSGSVGFNPLQFFAMAGQ
jgi:hypothetical protein